MHVRFELNKYTEKPSHWVGDMLGKSHLNNWIHLEGKRLFAAIHAPISHPSISVILSSLLYSQKQNLHKSTLEASVKTASLSPWDNS